MLFNSTQFLVFFPVVVLAYFALAHRHRWKLLLVASYYFYACWKPAYLLLIVASTLVDYTAGVAMSKQPERAARRKWLFASLTCNLGLLFAFKYYNLFALTWNYWTGGLIPAVELPFWDVLLPVGISFYTFQTLSYTIEVYLGRQEPETRLGMFALYVAYFPQLVAGPIERPQNLLKQLDTEHDFDAGRVTAGLQLMLVGLFKKMVIADNLAAVVEKVYGAPAGFHGPALVAATVAFAFQIFCDFSGYSDIAIGAAKVMGVDLMVNFRRPYHAASIREFWSRWHISLSTWFRDYVYIPLGGNRVALHRHYLNLGVVFVVSGLWHGASATFVVWGALHAAYVILAELTRGLRDRVNAATGLAGHPRLHRLLQVGWVFVLVCFAWIFFRANSLDDALHVVTGLGSGWGARGMSELWAGVIAAAPFQTVVGFGGVLLMEAYHLFDTDDGALERWARLPRPASWGIAYALILGILLLGEFGLQQFIYFQF